MGVGADNADVHEWLGSPSAEVQSMNSLLSLECGVFHDIYDIG